MKWISGLRICALSLMIYFVAGCSNEAGLDYYEEQTSLFIEHYNKGKFRDLYRTSHQDFKAYISEADFLKILSNLQMKLGKIDHFSRRDWSGSLGSDPNQTVKMIYQVSFEQDGQAHMIVSYKGAALNARLINFNVSSKKLM